MGQRRAQLGIGLAFCMAMVTGGAVMATDASPQAVEPATPVLDSGAQEANGGGGARAAGCRETFLKNSGLAAFNYCYSDDGNITMLEHSEGLEHVAVGSVTEGWCVSANHVKRGATFGDSPNEGLRAPHYPAPRTVVHRTTDGDLRVEQVFSRNYVNRRITVTMSVRNRSDSPINSVFLTRFIDADMSNSTGSDVWSSASRSVMVTEPGSARLELIPRTVKFNANSMIFNSFFPTLDEDCYDATADTTIEGTGDLSMAVNYQLGTIFPGESKTVRFDYRASI